MDAIFLFNTVLLQDIWGVITLVVLLVPVVGVLSVIGVVYNAIKAANAQDLEARDKYNARLFVCVILLIITALIAWVLIA